MVLLLDHGFYLLDMVAFFEKFNLRTKRFGKELKLKGRFIFLFGDRVRHAG